MYNEENLISALSIRRRLSLSSYNTLIVANQGEAGHFVMKADIMDIIQNTNNDVIVVDVFGEFDSDEIRAKKIVLSPGGKAYVNPLAPEDFTPYDDTNPHSSTKAFDLLFSMMRSMGCAPLPSHIRSATEAIKNAINRANESNKKNMTNILIELAKECDPEIKLFVYWVEQLKCFSEDTNIDLTQRCTILRMDAFDIHFRTVAAIAVLNHVLSAAREKYQKTNKCTWVYIPHIDALLERDPEGYIGRFFKTAKKWSTTCVGSTRKETGTFTHPCYKSCSCIYLMNPSSNADAWLNELDIPLQMIKTSTQMVCSLNGKRLLIH